MEFQDGIRRASLLVAACLVGACAGNKSGPGAIAPEDRLRQQGQTLRSEIAAQTRLDNLAYPLLRAATQFCGNSVGYPTSFRALNVAAYAKGWVDAARSIGIS